MTTTNHCQACGILTGKEYLEHSLYRVRSRVATITDTRAVPKISQAEYDLQICGTSLKTWRKRRRGYFVFLQDWVHSLDKSQEESGILPAKA